MLYITLHNYIYDFLCILKAKVYYIKEKKNKKKKKKKKKKKIKCIKNKNMMIKKNV